jgi:hypothetical protein
MARHDVNRRNRAFVARALPAVLGFLAVVLLPGAASGGPLQRLHGHVPPVVAGLPATGELPKSQQLRLVIGLPLRNREALEALLKELYDPGSPQYRKFLTPEQFAARFGPAEADYAAVAAFARGGGLTVIRAHPKRTFLDVTGSVADIEKAFHVTLRTYQHPTEARTFYAPDTEPALALEVPVLTVGGLNNYHLPRPMNLCAAAARAAGAQALTGSGPSSNYIGNDFRAAYVPGVALTGTGQTVGLLEFDGYDASDIASYESLASLPPVALTNVLIDGASGSAGQDSDEVSLDIEMAISMAPGLSAVVVYEDSPYVSTGDDMLDEMAAPTQGEPLSLQLSASWTFTTDANSDQIFQQFAAQGQSYFNASGDSDAYADASEVPTPAGDTNITIVGGTTLTTTGPGGSWRSETAWNWGYDTNALEDVGTSGGITSFAIPYWQQGIDMQANQGSTTYRNIPDVALTADDVWVIYGGGQSGAFGGTSCATPLWAALTALVNEQATNAGLPPMGFLNPALYALGKGSSYAACFHDITSGNNTNSSSPNLYYAVAGYDLCTGWGTPNGAGLINALAPPGLSISPAAGFTSTGYVGGPFSVTNQTFALSNLSATTLTWSLANNASWLSVSASGGTLAPGGSPGLVKVSLNATATNLSAGTYSDTIWFTNQQNGTVQSRLFTLEVQVPPDALQIIPATGFSSSGVIGGPFTVTSESFTLTNISAASLTWSLANTSQWLNVSSTSGRLAPGAASALTVSLNSAASTLAAGAYAATVGFTNLHDNVVQSRGFSLTVESQQLVQNGGFETGTFSGWTESGRHSALEELLVSTNPQVVHSGNYGAALGAPSSLGYLSQTLTTTPGQLYMLSFWLSSNGETPNQFTASWNGNTLFDESDIPALVWTNCVYEVSATSSSTVLQFGGMDQPWFLGLDDVSVVPVVEPRFLSASRAAGVFNCSWTVVPGLSYQVQYQTNLLQTNWVSLGAAISPTNTVGSFSDSSSDQRRFYRILVVP